MKVCFNCNEEKPESEFYKNKRSKGGLHNQCKDCVKAKVNSYYEENKEYINNKKREWNDRNKDRIKQWKDWYYQENRESILDNKKRYYQENKDKLRVYKRDWKREKYKNDPEFRMREFMRDCLRRVLKVGTGESSAKVLGYDRKQLMQRIECQFQPGMSWENHGEWEIDHRLSIDYFRKKGEDRPHIINALSNLQPLWKDENASKTNKHPNELSK